MSNIVNVQDLSGNMQNLSIASGGELQAAADLINSQEEAQQLTGLGMLKGMVQTTEGGGKLANSHGVVERLMALVLSQNPQIQYESLLVLLNLCVDNTESVVRMIGRHLAAECIRLLHPFSNVNNDIRENALWLLGNIIGHSVEYRDEVLSMDFNAAFLACFDKYYGDIKLMRIAAWVLANIFREKINDNSQEILILRIVRMFQDHVDTEIICEALSAFSYITEQDRQYVLKMNDLVLCRIMRFLCHPEENFCISAIKIIQELSLESSRIQFLVDNGIFTYLRMVLRSTRPFVRKTACCILTNVTTENPIFVDLAIEAQLYPLVFSCFDTTDKKLLPLREEAAWALVSVIDHKVAKHIRYLTSLERYGYGMLHRLDKLLPEVQTLDIYGGIISALNICYRQFNQ